MRLCTGVDRAKFILLWTALLLSYRSVAVAGVRNYAPFPQPDAGYVTDLAGLLTDEQQQRLEASLLETEKRSGVEIVVVTIRSLQDYPGTPDRTIEEFARALFDAYGVGNRPQNNGVLLLVAAQDRKARIELGAGYGHARDRDAERIMARRIVPSFRRGQYAAGIISGVNALVREFDGSGSLARWLPWAVPGIVIAVVLVVVSLFRQGKRGWGWVVAGSFIVLLLAVFWFGRRVVEGLSEADSGPGGFGGFGGGFSGGGGATGSW